MIHTVTLNPALDQRIVVDRLVSDDVNRAPSVFFEPGGKGINVSKTIHALGGETRAFSFAGGATGRRWMRALSALGIRVSAVRTSREMRINTTLVDRSKRECFHIAAAGPDFSRSEFERLRAKILTSCKPGDFCVISGSAPPQSPRRIYFDLIRALRQKGVRCVLDADGELFREAIRAKPFLVKPNEFELSRWAGKRLKTLDQILRASDRLLRFCEIVVVSMASKGVLFRTPGISFLVEVPPVRVERDVGAGDALVAGFVWALSGGSSLEESAKKGVSTGLATVIRPPHEPCRLADVKRFASRIRLRAV